MEKHIFTAVVIAAVEAVVKGRKREGIERLVKYVDISLSLSLSLFSLKITMTVALMLLLIKMKIKLNKVNGSNQPIIIIQKQPIQSNIIHNRKSSAPVMLSVKQEQQRKPFRKNIFVSIIFCENFNRNKKKQHQSTLLNE